MKKFSLVSILSIVLSFCIVGTTFADASDDAAADNLLQGVLSSPSSTSDQTVIPQGNMPTSSSTSTRALNENNDKSSGTNTANSTQTNTPPPSDNSSTNSSSSSSSNPVVTPSGSNSSSSTSGNSGNGGSQGGGSSAQGGTAGDTSTQGSSLNATPTVITVTEDVPGMYGIGGTKDCSGTGPEDRKCNIEIKPGFETIMNILSGLIRYATFIVALIGVFMLVIAGIQYSMSGFDKESAGKAKGKIQKIIGGLVLLFLIGFILNTVAPWIYRI